MPAAWDASDTGSLCRCAQLPPRSAVSASGRLTTHHTHTHYHTNHQWQIHAGALGVIAPLKWVRKIFLNVSENKSSDRKLICTFWYSCKRFRHYTECINTAASGGLHPQILSGNTAPCTPNGCPAHRPPLRPPQHKLPDLILSITLKALKANFH